MNRDTRLFLLFTIGAGALSVAISGMSVSPANYYLLAAIVAVGVLLAGVRTQLTDIIGPLAVNFVILLTGMQLLSRAETTVACCLVTLVQILRRSDRGGGWLEAIFRIAVTSVSTGAAYSLGQLVSINQTQLNLSTRLVMATLAFCVTHHMLHAMLGWMRSRTWNKKALRAAFWALPYYLVGAIVASSLAILKASFGWQVILPLVPLVFLIYRHSRLYITRMEDEFRHTGDIQALHMRSIEALALAIEAKDHNSHDKLDQVQLIAMTLGEQLALPKPEMDALRAASLLRDIGKLAVPEHIISKAGKLTREEFEKVKTHPLVGAQILERMEFPYPVAPIVRHHHERFNGGGYPDGINGTQIPMGARILAVADAFVSFTSDRPHRTGITPDQAMARISLEAGISFDPVVVDTMKRLYLDLDRIATERREGRAKLTTDWNTHRAENGNGGAPVEPEKKAPEGFLAAIAAARQEGQILFELAQQLGNSLSLDETLSVFAGHLQRTIPYDAVAIFVRRETILRPEFASGENLRAFSSLEIPVGHGVSGWAAENRKPVVNGNPMLEPGYEEDLSRTRSMKSVLAFPLECASGVVGVLSLYSTRKEAFNRDHLRVLQAISAKLALSIENALKYRQAEDSASTDYLTGLLNARSLFLHLDGELARCRRLETPLAILVSDLDGFKGVNDRFGHLEGNKLLQRVAAKLKESCREYDCVARMGGDEFVIVLPGLSKELVRSLIPRLREKVKEAGLEVLHEDVIGFSVGEAYFPEDGTDAEHVLAEADKRMYTFKSRTKMLKEKQRGFAFDNSPA